MNEIQRLQQLAGIIIESNVDEDLKILINYLNKNNIPIKDRGKGDSFKYIDNNGKLKIHSDEVYDFGGSWDPIPYSIVVDGDKPEGNNIWINRNLENYFNLPPKKYINLTSVLHFINNKNNLIKSINDSLNPKGILLIQTSLNQIIKIIPLLYNFNVIEVSIDMEWLYDKESINDDLISIIFEKN
jgi:hypothetical protein